MKMVGRLMLAALAACSMGMALAPAASAAPAGDHAWVFRFDAGTTRLLATDQAYELTDAISDLAIDNDEVLPPEVVDASINAYLATVMADWITQDAGPGSCFELQVINRGTPVTSLIGTGFDRCPWQVPSVSQTTVPRDSGLDGTFSALA
ncbi:hypothetical protein [Gordonia sp. NPDC003950]